MSHIKFFLTLGSCLLLIFFHCGCVENKQDAPVIMTFGELINDYKSTYNWEASYRTENFTSLKEGDILILRDQIHNLTYRSDENITSIEFSSSTGLDNFFSIQGNITGSFRPGDIVDIHLHIIKVTFRHIENERSLTIERETFQEGYDTTTNTYIPVPSQYISLASSAQ